MKVEGGNNQFDAVKRIMLKLAPNSVRAQFNRTGGYERRKFPAMLEMAIKGFIIYKWFNGLP